MRANQPTWTEERLELLKSHFEAGLSCRQIAAAIGVSRNAVIGKLSRLNLARDNNGEERPAQKNTTKERRAKTAPRQQYQMLVALYGEPLDVTNQAIQEPIQDGHRCSLLELSEERCRWPINTPGTDDFCFCGNMPIKSLPYCAGHSRLAYRPNSQYRIARK
jgi:GcrA cell cycle regulator